MKNLVFVCGIMFNSFVSIAQETMCTEQVIDSLESGSPFMVGETIEWIALGDDNISLPPIDGDNTTLILDGNVVPSGGPIEEGTTNSITFSGVGDEGALGTSNITCNSHPLIIFTVVAVLPVEWSKTPVVEILNNRSLITFSTAQQVNNSHFEIEHSSDGKIFQPIGTIIGEGNTSIDTDYQYTHETPSQGVNYYRVKQVDFDGQYSYSNVASVIYRADEINVYPNPVKDFVTISLPNQSNVKVYNHLGQQIDNYELTEGENTLEMTSLESGLYLLKFDDGTMKRVVKR